jgi:hypothetical protein
VARYSLIDGYLDTMRTEIRWRRDLDDLVSEMEDHLYTAVESMVSRGIETDAAQRTTLTRFGEPDVLAAVYASTDTGGLAVPTTFTKRAGTFALVSAFFWLAAGLSHLFMTGRNDDWQQAYMALSAFVLIGGVFGILAMIGISKRLGGLGVLGMVGLAIVAFGVFTSLIAWAVFLWMTVQGVGYLVFGYAVLRRDGTPKTSTLLVSSGFIVGSIAFVVANVLNIGWRDSYGDYPLAWTIGTATGVVILAAGFAGWGMWLRTEEPIDIDSDNDSAAITA